MKRFLCVVGLFALTVGAMPAGAAGPTKLKQPKTFPITITKPGSYILVSTLTVPDANTTAISVQADYVAIDLNGFSIQGPVVCTGLPASCSPTGGGTGIDSSGHGGVMVRNGMIHGMGAAGIFLSGATGRAPFLVENVIATGNGGAGIYSEGGTVTNSTASFNGFDGIDGVTITSSSTDWNGGTGISAFSSTVTGCEAGGNGSGQISGAAGIAGHNTCNGSPCP